MNYIVENWFIIMALVIILACIIVAIVNFIKSGKESQLSNLKSWLLYATALAEKELGSGTGQLKLRYVYDMFVIKFPWLAKMLSFETFSNMVDDALDSMKELLYTNDYVREYVKGEDKEEC